MLIHIKTHKFVKFANNNLALNLIIIQTDCNKIVQNNLLISF